MADKRLEIELEIAHLRETVAKLEESANATSKGTEANKENSKSILQQLEHSRGFHRVLHSITEESPLAGLALHAAFSGPGAALAALVLALHALKKAEEEAKKAAEESAVAASKGFGDAEESVNRAVDEVRKAQAAHEQWVKSLSDGSKKVRDELDLNIAKLKAESDAVREVNKAQGKPTEGVDFVEQHAQLKLTQDAVSKLATERAAAATEEQRATGAAGSGRAGRVFTSAEMDKRASEDKADAEKAKEALAKAQEARAEASENVRFPTVTNTLMDMLSIGKLFGQEGAGSQRSRQAFEKAQAGEDKAAAAFRDADTRAKKESDNAAKAKAEQESLDKAAEDAQKKLKALDEQLKELSKTATEMGIKVGFADVGNAMSGGRSGDRITDVVVRGAAAEAANMRFRASSTMRDKDLADLSTLLKATHDVVGVVRSHAGDVVALAGDVARLKAEAAAIKAQIKNTHAP